ncbi:MAG: phosphoribosyltransferase [Saprospiraceae bacterium]|nr:phosphoribosyltransferase [Saprospiraceae bacterium]MBK8370557.1 phosphoribosyltransferase [Saprospiraceae bacterium]MBK8546524.1 phosphoribosyltransferase [Saprospiraceae bacterium]MBK8817644.1 phosphoribosyltransferase [Saprospiraceae bacterium]MBK8854590.1 phosphoribosyltransferase [Saprospiraceae bacterium]
MQILQHDEILTRIKRLAIEILENNLEEKEIILAGINTSGYVFAGLLYKALKKKNLVPVSLTKITINPAQPLLHSIETEKDVAFYDGKSIIVIDDVANTGRTIFYACKPFMAVLPKKIEVAVLVDRSHKSFPIKVDYKGLSLATTFQEHIKANLTDLNNISVEIH